MQNASHLLNMIFKMKICPPLMSLDNWLFADNVIVLGQFVAVTSTSSYMCVNMHMLSVVYQRPDTALQILIEHWDSHY